MGTPCAWEIADEFGIPVIINVPGPLAMMANITWPFIMTFCFNVVKAQGREEASSAWWMFTRISHVIHSKPCLFHTFFGLEPPQRLLPNHVITGTTAPRSSGQVQKTSHSQ